MRFTMLVSGNVRTAPYRISQYHSAARVFCGPSLGAPHRRHMSGRELDRKRNNEGRRDGRVHDGNQTGTISMIGPENETWTSLHRQRSMESVLPTGVRGVRCFVER